MTRFMVGDLALLQRIHFPHRVCHSDDLLLNSLVDVLLNHVVAALKQCVAHGILGDGGHDLGRRGARGIRDDRFDIDLLGIVSDLGQVALDDRSPTDSVGAIDLNDLIEPSGSEQRRVQNVRSVRRAHK